MIFIWTVAHLWLLPTGMALGGGLGGGGMHSPLPTIMKMFTLYVVDLYNACHFGHTITTFY